MHRSFATAASPVALAAALAATLATAADPPPAPPPRLTRAELVRQWDLNSDGKIDAGEAEIASSRMRRERAEMRLQGGIDPVTGLPRDTRSDASDEPAEQPVQPITAEDLFGTDKKPTTTGTTGASAAKDGTGDKATTSKPPTAGPPRFGLPRNAGRQDARFAPITGGVRAGAPAARPGYGSKLPVAPLNAGRSIDSIAPPPGMAAAPGSGQPLPTTSGGVRGGLLPTPRPAPAPRPVRRSQDPYDPY